MGRRNYLLESPRRMRPEAGSTVGVVWSPSSKLFAPLSVDVSVYTLSGDRPIYRKKPASAERYVSVALLDDGVVVGKKTPEVWDLETGEVRRKLKVRVGWGTGLSDSTLVLSGDGSLLVGLSGYTYRCAVWDTKTWNTVGKFYLEEEGRFVSAAFSPDNHLMALGDTFGNVFFVDTHGKRKEHWRLPLPGVREVVDWENWQNFRYGETHVGWKGNRIVALARAKVEGLAVPILYVIDAEKRKITDILNLPQFLGAYAVQEVLVEPDTHVETSLQAFEGGWAVVIGTTTLLLDDHLKTLGVVWEGPISVSPDGRYYVPYGGDIRGVQVYGMTGGDPLLPYVPLGEVRSMAHGGDGIILTTSRGEVAVANYEDGESRPYGKIPGRAMGSAPWKDGSLLLLTSVAPRPDALLSDREGWETRILIAKDGEIVGSYALEDLPLVYPEGTLYPVYVGGKDFKRVRPRFISSVSAEAFAVLFLNRAHIYVYGKERAVLKYEGVESLGFWRDGFMLKEGNRVRMVNFNGEEYEVMPEDGEAEGDYFPVHAPDSPEPILISDTSIIVGNRRMGYEVDMGIVFLLNRAIGEGPTVIPAHYNEDRGTVLIPNASYVIAVPLEGTRPKVVRVERKENAGDYAVEEVLCRRNTLYVLSFGEIRVLRRRGLKCP